jgi:hypothetical protein
MVLHTFARFVELVASNLDEHAVQGEEWRPGCTCPGLSWIVW